MEFQSVKDIFEKEDLESLVILTYELDDSALFDICLSGSRAIKGLNSVKPVIFFDARKTNETFKAPPTVELIPYHKSGGKHHSKAYLFSTEKEVHLILGSLNLTKPGLLRNKEVFKHFKWSNQETDNISVLFSFIDLLKKYYSGFESENLANSILLIEEMIDGLSGKVNDFTLLHSGYEETGLDLLKREWDQSGAMPSKSLLSISPFFDIGDKNIIQSLGKQGLAPSNIKLITSRGFSEKLPITQRYYESVAANHDVSVYESEDNINPQTDEWNAIIDHEKQLGNRVKDDQEFRRNLHAKIHAWEADKNSLIYFGSANFTLNAWTGKNCELGLICWCDASIAEIDEALSNIYQVPKEAAPSDALSVEMDIDDTGEEIEGMKHFPDFIKSIRLQNVGTDLVKFAFKIDDNSNDLDSYKIEWGEIAIKVEKCESQEFDLKTCMNLFLKRSLKFTHKDSKRVYFLPYVFNRELTDVIKINELGGSCDYIEAFLGDTSIDYETELFFEMYGTNEGIEHRISDVDRENNLTIKMQRFTTLLPRLEAKFRSLVDEIRASKVLKDINTKRFLFEPIKEIVSVMEKEYEAEQSIASAIYKLGEILLIIRSLDAQELSEVEDLIKSKFDHYFQMYKGNSSIFGEYVKYVNN